MVIRRSTAVALIAAAGVAGAVIERFVPCGTPSVQAARSASPALSATGDAGQGCQAERTELASVEAQLAFCMALGARRPEEPAPEAPARAELDPPPGVESPIATEIRRARERLDSLPQAVIVQHADGTIGYHDADAWPSDGDGLIIGRKLPDGQIGWYAGQDAGPRSDPAAFRRPESTIVLGPNVVRESDGTLRVRRDAPPWMKRLVNGEAEEPAEP